MSGSRADRSRLAGTLAAAALLLSATLPGAGAQTAAPAGGSAEGPLILGPVGRPPPADAVRAEPLPAFVPTPVLPSAVSGDSGADLTVHEVSGDLGADLWAGSARADIARLIADLPPRIDAPTLNMLVRRALLTEAVPPRGPAPSPDMPVLSVAALATLGDLDGASARADAIPAKERTEDLSRLSADLDLLRGDLDSACATGAEAIAKSTDAYWQKLVSFCQVREDRRDQAALATDLLRDRGHRDPAYFALMDTLLGFDKAKISTLPSITPLQFAMLQAAKLPLPPDAAESAKPALLRAVAQSEGTDLAVRLTAAEQAVAANALDPAILGKLYLQGGTAWTAAARPGAEGVSAETAAERAALFRSARTATERVPRAAALKQLFDAAARNGVLRPVAEISMPLMRDLRPAAHLSFFAPQAVRAAVSADEPAVAAEWFRIALREAPGNPLAARGAAEVWPLMMLAAPDTAWSDQLFRTWWEQQLERDAARAAERAAAFLALLEALDTRVPAQAWSLLPPSTPQRGQAVPALRDLRTAAEKRRRGETLLRTAVATKANPDRTPESARLHAIVTALRTAGFGAQARSFAVDAAVGLGI